MSFLELLPKSEETEHPANVAENERIASLIAGAAILGYGIFRRSGSTPLFALLGGLLIRRGFTGRCPAYQRLGVDTAHSKSPSGIADGEGFRIEKTITVDRSPTEVFHYGGIWKISPDSCPTSSP